MSREDLFSFEYVATLGRTPEKINRLKATLIREFKGCVWCIGTTRQSVDSNFMKMDSVRFGNFRISGKWT